MKLADMSVSLRLGIGFGAVLLLALFIGVSGFWGLRTLDGEVMRLLKGDVKVSEHAARARANVNALRRYEKDFFINMGNKEKEEGYMKSWRGQHESLMARLNDLEKYASIQHEKDAVEEMKQRAAIYDAGFNKVVKAIHEGNIQTTQDANTALGEFKDATHKLEAQAKELAEEANKRMEGSEALMDAVMARAEGVMTIFGVICVVIAVGVGFIVTRSITKPLTRVIAGLTDGSEQIASASSQVSSASQSLAEGASEQASGLEETSSSIEEMASQTKQNADNAQQANALMADTSKVVEEANLSMVELTESMKDISTASEETAKIIKTIDEIAFQTNLLALNAAVEAARAGEAGAGFAVVADEVRNLALRAADAAKNTANLIEGTVKKIKNGSDLVAKTNEAFGKVATGAKKVGELVGEISASSNEQAQGVNQINKAVAEMDKVVQQNAANAEESAAASEEMNAQAEQMRDFVGELVMMVRGSNGNGVVSSASLRQVETGHRQTLALTHQPKRTVHKALATPVKYAKGTAFKKVVRPEEVIPLEDGDFKDF